MNFLPQGAIAWEVARCSDRILFLSKSNILFQYVNGRRLHKSDVKYLFNFVAITATKHQLELCLVS